MGKSGGKGGSVREPVVKVVAEVELKVEEELPKNSKCLMDCEAAVILQGIQEQLGILCQDPAIKIPESFSKGLEYAKTGSHYMDPMSVRQALSYSFTRVLEHTHLIGKIGVFVCALCIICSHESTGFRIFNFIFRSLKQSKVSDGEIGNSFPETVDEVFAVVPSLKANRTRNEGPIKDVLSE